MKAKLAQRVRDGLDSDGQKALLELIDELIGKCHKHNETYRGDDFLVTQGKIQGYRELQGTLTKQPKPKK